MNAEQLKSNKHLKSRLATMAGFDAEMAGLMDKALDFITPRQLGLYIDAVDRFNRDKNFVDTKSRPGEFLLDLSGGERIYWANLRNDLEELPAYFTAMSMAGVAQNSAFKLITLCHTSQKYDFGSTCATIRSLTKIAHTCRESKIDLNAGLPRLHDLIKLSAVEGEQLRVWGICNLALKAGFSVDQAATTIEDIHEHAWNAGYGMMGLYDELDAIKTHSLPPTQLFNALRLVTKYGRSYKELSYGMAKAATLGGAAGVHTFTANVIKAGQGRDCLAAGDAPLPVPLSEAQMLEPAEFALSVLHKEATAQGDVKQAVSPENYFPDIGVPRLLHGALPYRLQRNLQDGIEDLRALCQVEHPEGAFIYDRPSQTWFSLGGRSAPKQDGRGFRHEYYPYDISKISTDPLFVHVHPLGPEIYVCPPREALTHTCMQKRLTKFFATVPSAADFRILATIGEAAPHLPSVQGLIVTSAGLTSFMAPNDGAHITEFANQFTALKDQVLLEYDVDAYLWSKEGSESDEAFARRMVGVVNDRLPGGFRIQTLDYEDAFVEAPSLVRLKCPSSFKP